MRKFPSDDAARKAADTISGTGQALSTGVTVPANQYGVIWKLWLGLDVGSEADLENLPALLVLGITIGSTSIQIAHHPYIVHTDAHATNPQEHRYVDLGPWSYDFGKDGLYSGVKGDDIDITVGAPGTGIKSQVAFIYSGEHTK